MWNLIHCYLSGRHDYGMWCEPGSIFLRCVHCGKRSSGWSMEPKAQELPAVRATPTTASARSSKIPFGRVAAR